MPCPRPTQTHICGAINASSISSVPAKRKAGLEPHRAYKGKSEARGVSSAFLLWWLSKEKVKLFGPVRLFVTPWTPCAPTRLLCPWDSPGKNTGVGCHFLLQGIFPTQGSNPGLPHYRQTLYRLNHQGSCLQCKTIRLQMQETRVPSLGREDSPGGGSGNNPL